MIARPAPLAFSFAALLLAQISAFAAELNTPANETTDATFQRDVVDESSTHVVIVAFVAPWCGPCRAMVPTIRDASVAGKFRFVTLNVDANSTVQERLKVTSIPYFVAYRGRRLVGTHSGAWSARESLESFLVRAGN